MELVEPIEYINEQLVSLYGNEPYADDKPRFQVVFSNDQFEKRWTDKTKDGFDLLYPEVRELPKYRHYIQGKYILERLVPINTDNTDLTVKVGYEPAHVFMDKNHNYLPPKLDMCCVVIDNLLRLSGKKTGTRKYNDPGVDPEYRQKMVKQMQADLYGNETEAMDAVHYKEGIVNPAGQIEYREQQSNSTQKVERSVEDGK